MKITKSHFLTAARTGYCILGATALVLLYLVSAWWIVELIWWVVRGEAPAPVVLYREHVR